MIRNVKIIASHFSSHKSSSAINGRLVEPKLREIRSLDVHRRSYFASSICESKVTSDVTKIVSLLRKVPTKSTKATVDWTNAILPNANNGFDLLAKGMWQLVRNKEYRVVGVAFDKLIPIMKQVKAATSPNTAITEDAVTKIILAAMVANGSLLRPAKVNKILVEHLPLPSKDSNNLVDFQIEYNKKLVDKLLSALFHSYAVADKLDTAIQFICEWLKCDIETLSAVDTKSVESAKVLYRQLSTREDNQPREQLDQSTKQLFQLLRDYNTKGELLEDASIRNSNSSNEMGSSIPLEVWSAAVRMFSVRCAWTHCLYILNHIESGFSLGSSHGQATRTDPLDISSSIDVGDSGSHLVQLENLLDFRYFIEVHDGDSESESSDTNGIALLSNHSGTVGHCISSIYHHTIAALCHGHQFETALEVLGHMQKSGIRVEVVSTVSLLRGLYCSSPSRTYSVTPENIVLSRELALGLLEDVFSTVHQLHGHSTARPAQDTSPVSAVVVALASSYLTVLCELGLTSTAHSLLSRIRAMEVGRGHSSTAGRTSAGKNYLSSLLNHTLIESDRKRGDWRSARDTYSYYSSPVTEKNMEEEENLTTLQRKGRSQPPASLDAGVQSVRSYHAVCSAMLRSGEVEELTSFIERNHQLHDHENHP